MTETPKQINRTAFGLALISGIALLVSASLQAMSILSELGFRDVFLPVRLSGDAPVKIALYLTFPMLGAAFLFWGGLQISKRLKKWAAAFSISGIVLSLIGLPVPQILGFGLRPESLVGTVISVVLAGVAMILSIKTPEVEAKKEPVLASIEVATVGIFSAMTAVLTGMVGAFIPSPTGGYTHIGDTAIFMAALLFGSKVGAAAGVIGSVVADFYVGYSRWFVSIPAHGIEGAFAGFGRNKSTAVRVIVCLFGGFVMASVYFYVNIFIKGYPVAIISYARDLVGQVGVSTVLAIVLTKVVEKILPQLKR